MTDEELLRHYWIELDMESVKSFDSLSEDIKQQVRESYGFHKYILAARVYELKKVILDEIKQPFKFIAKLFLR